MSRVTTRSSTKAGQVFPFIWVKYRDISTKIRNIPRTSDVDDLIDAAYDSPHFGTISGQILPYYRGEQLKRSTKLEDINDIDNTTEMDPILLDNSQQQQHGNTELEDVKRRLDNLELNKEISHDLTVTAAANYHKALSDQGKSTVDPNHHREWLNSTLNECFECDFKKENCESDVQDFWSQLIPEINVKCHGDIVFADTHLKATINKKTPDIVIHKRGQCPTSMNIVAVGELKFDSLDGSCKGELEDYLASLLGLQQFRYYALGFLTNNQEFLMVEARRYGLHRSNIKFVWFIEQNFTGGDAKVALSWLSSLSLVGHGYILPVDSEIVKLNRCIGYGKYSTVYHGTTPDNSEVVVKVIPDSYYLEREKSNLKLLQEKCVPNVSKLLQSFENVLIMWPYANHLKILDVREKHIRAMVNTLHKAHQVNLVHRDIRYPNLFLTKDDGVLVNDWGSAVSEGNPQEYSGVTVEGSKAILSALKAGKTPSACPNDDLHALARTIFRMLVALPQFKNQQHDKTFYQKLLEFWSQVSDHWNDVFELADNADAKDKNTYEQFADALAKLLPCK